ncbi:MAG: DUF302 domain-containing protein [Candidatus Nitrosopolaris sp.]
MPHRLWPSGDGTRIYVLLENGDRLVAIDTLTNKVIGSSPIGQGGQAMAYVPNAVPEGNGTQGLQPLGIAGNATHLSITSKPFEEVLASLEAAIGHPDMVEYTKATHASHTFAEYESVVHKHLGPTGLMMFMKFDLGAVLRKETGLDTPKIVRYLIGNPLIAIEMTKYVPDAGSYAPVTILVDERPDGVHLSYDKMASFLAPYGNSNALTVARDLDSKIENLLRESAGVKNK